MKKTNKRRYLGGMLAAALLVLPGCYEYGIDSQQEMPPQFYTDAMDNYSFTALSAPSVKFQMSANTPWSIVSDSQWCIVTPSMSASSSLVAEIELAVEDNPTVSERRAVLTISAENVDETKTVTVIQEAKDEFAVVPYDGIVSFGGAWITFRVITNKAWTVVPSAQFLENMDKMSGEGSDDPAGEVVTVSVPANTAARREGRITVKTALSEKTFTVVQDGIVIEAADPLESGFVEMGSGLQEQEIGINANVDWKVTVPEEFAGWIEAEAVSADVLKLSTVGYNPMFVQRTGYVLLEPVSPVSGFEPVQIAIRQDVEFTFTSPEECVIDGNDGKVKVSGGNIVSKYAFRKGHLTFEFEEIHFTDNARLFFNMYTADAGDNCNFTYGLSSDSSTNNNTLRIGGHFGWAAPVPVSLTNEQINTVKKVEFYIEEDPEDTEKLRIRLLLDGQEKASFTGRTDPYAVDPDLHASGLQVNLQFVMIPDGNYYTLKSISYEPYE